MTIPREHGALIPADRQFQAPWGVDGVARRCLVGRRFCWRLRCRRPALNAGPMDVPAAGAIVFDQAGRLLLIRRLRPPGAGLWSIPGGKCLLHETAAQACVRECGEETNLQVEVVRSVGSVYLPAPGGDRFLVEDFLCAVIAGGTARAGDDAAELRWATRNELAELPLVTGLLDALTGWNLLPAPSG
jgi:ADP-ribose pyrophosphatase YjhB (NUDIX family)